MIASHFRSDFEFSSGLTLSSCESVSSIELNLAFASFVGGGFCSLLVVLVVALALVGGGDACRRAPSVGGGGGPSVVVGLLLLLLVVVMLPHAPSGGSGSDAT